MMVIGAIIVFLYTFLGGYLSVCTTDLIQGTLMFFALATVFIGSVTAAGGVENTVGVPAGDPRLPLGHRDGHARARRGGPAGRPRRQRAHVRPEPASYGIVTIVRGLAWGLGYFGMPQVLIRFMSIRHSDEIKKSRIIAMIWLVVSLSSAVCIGLIGRAVIPTEFLTQSAAESVFIVLSKMLLPSFFCGLVVSGIFAAAMSSSSSYLLISGSAVATNIFKGLIKRDATDNQVMIVARITLTVILLLGIFLAMDQNSSIFDIVSYAWAGFGASFGPLMLLLAVLAPHHAARRRRRHADRRGHRGGVEDAQCRRWAAGSAVYELLPGFVHGATAVIVVVSLADQGARARKSPTSSTPTWIWTCSGAPAADPRTPSKRGSVASRRPARAAVPCPHGGAERAASLPGALPFGRPSH